MVSMFSATSFEDIEAKANDILLAYNITDCPAKYLHEVAKQQGIGYNESDKFSNETDGFYIVKGQKKAIIVKKTVTPFERKNYTIAHELGHHFIGHCFHGGTMECKITESAQYDNTALKEYERKEREANIFASNFLMPKKLVEPVVQQALVSSDRVHIGFFYLDKQSCNIRDWQICCSFMQSSFRTSKTAIKWRLYNLGYAKGHEFQKIQGIIKI